MLVEIGKNLSFDCVYSAWGRLERGLYQKCRINTYELIGPVIVRHQGLFRKEELPLAQIEEWSVEYEMGVDIVSLRTRDGENVTWLDDYDDLLGILRSALPEKQRTEW